MRLFGRARATWPEVTHTEIVKRARILVIDDGDFPYLALFREAGYNIDKWDDVKDLSGLEQGNFDLLLLDLHGVGQRLSADHGPGLIGHLHKVNPALVVVAYSNADWSLEYKVFFDQADAALHKTKADYVEFKRTVDELLDKRFSKGFFIERIANAVPPALSVSVAQRAEEAILKNDVDGLRRYLVDHIDDHVTVERIIGLAQVAIGIVQIWKS